MVSTVDQAFEVEGILVDDKTAILTGDDHPSFPGTIAPVGTLYMRTNGLHYRKTGILDNQWTQTDAGGGGGGPQYLQFSNRLGAAENILIIEDSGLKLPFFNRAAAPENIAII
jgi:hypothetical protein